MYRVSVMASGIYAKAIQDVVADADDIETMAQQGECVIICDELETLESIGLNPRDVTVVG